MTHLLIGSESALAIQGTPCYVFVLGHSHIQSHIGDMAIRSILVHSQGLNQGPPYCLSQDSFCYELLILSQEKHFKML